MDSFIDKLASKFNAEELMKANAHAENAQMENLQRQVEEYEKVLQEMRKLNYKNVELSEKMEQILGVNSTKIANLQADELKILDLLRKITNEQNETMEALQARDEKQEEQQALDKEEAERKAKENIEAITELFKKSDDFTHKEDVKVYRNVQAVIIDELKKRGEEQELALSKIRGRATTALIFSLFSFIGIIASIALEILIQLGILVF